MAGKKRQRPSQKRQQEKMRPVGPIHPAQTPPGATRAAFDRPLAPRGGPPGSGAGDPHAQGTPGGGSEFGGLGGTNIGEGDPNEVDLEETMAGPAPDDEDIPEEERVAYGGISGGTVGGTPAGSRSSGGHIHGGLAPGGTHRGDSTLGTEPDEEEE
jgi:hypothetical protein